MSWIARGAAFGVATVLVVAAPMGAFATSSGRSGTAQTAAAADDQVTSPATAASTTITSADGNVSIEIPDAAAPPGVQVSVAFVAPDAVPAELASIAPDGYYDLLPSGTVFTAPVRVSRRYEAAEIGDVLTDGVPLSLALLRHEDGTWGWLADPTETVDLDDGSVTVSGTTDRFSDLLMPLAGDDLAIVALALAGASAPPPGLHPAGFAAFVHDQMELLIPLDGTDILRARPEEYVGASVAPGGVDTTASGASQRFYCEREGESRLGVDALYQGQVDPPWIDKVSSAGVPRDVAGQVPPLALEVNATVTCLPQPATVPRCHAYEIADSKFDKSIPSKPFPDSFIETLVFLREMAGGSVTLAMTGANNDQPVSGTIGEDGRVVLRLGMERDAHLQPAALTVTAPAASSPTDVKDHVFSEYDQDIALPEGSQGLTSGQCPPDMALPPRVIAIDEGRLTLEVPADVAPLATAFGATLHPAADIPAPLAGLHARSFYSLEPAGTRFGQPVRVSRHYTSDELGVDVHAQGLPLAGMALAADDGTVAWMDDLRMEYDRDDGSLKVGGTTGHFSGAYVPYDDDFAGLAKVLGGLLLDDPDWASELPIGVTQALGIVVAPAAAGGASATLTNGQVSAPSFMAVNRDYRPGLIYGRFACQEPYTGMIAVSGEASSDASHVQVESVLGDLSRPVIDAFTGALLTCLPARGPGPSGTPDSGGPPVVPITSLENACLALSDKDYRKFVSRLVLQLLFPLGTTGTVEALLTGVNDDKPVQATVRDDGSARMTFGVGSLRRGRTVGFEKVVLRIPDPDDPTAFTEDDITGMVSAIFLGDVVIEPGTSSGWWHCPVDRPRE